MYPFSVTYMNTGPIQEDIPSCVLPCLQEVYSLHNHWDREWEAWERNACAAFRYYNKPMLSCDVAVFKVNFTMWTVCLNDYD